MKKKQTEVSGRIRDLMRRYRENESVQKQLSNMNKQFNNLDQFVTVILE